MKPFEFSTSGNPRIAVNTVSANASASFLAGGTNILDLMKENVAQPSALVGITTLPLDEIRGTRGGVSLGALASNAETANHPLVRRDYPLLSMAILAGATGQIRNMATNGGNLFQRTRCPYFYDTAMPCNKREPGTGCGALEGINRTHAIFGWSDKCVATYPSDMAIALAALDAIVHVQGAGGAERSIPFADFHRLPGETPQYDNTLRHGELVTAIEIPKNPFAAHSHYLKVRDRSSYAFALVSSAAALELDGNRIKSVRIALGGVAHKPWRALQAEQMLVGREATPANFELAAQAEMKGARPLEHNAYKIELTPRVMVRALQLALQGQKV